VTKELRCSKERSLLAFPSAFVLTIKFPYKTEESLRRNLAWASEQIPACLRRIVDAALRRIVDAAASSIMDEGTFGNDLSARMRMQIRRVNEH